jgi:PAS domain S-box-containing protein
MSRDLIEKIYFIAFNVIACIVFSLFSIIVHETVKTKERNDKWVVRSHEITQEVHLATIEVLQSELLLRNYFITENKDIKNHVIALNNSITKRFQKIEKAMGDNAQQVERIKEVQKQYRIFIESYDKLIRLYDQNKISRNLVENIQQRHMAGNRLEKLLVEFDNKEQDMLVARMGAERRSQTHYRNTILFGAMLSILLLVTTSTLIYTTLLKQRKKITSLLDSDELLRDLLENMNDGVFDYDMTTGEVQYSPAYFKQLGYDQPIVKGNTVNDVFLQLIHPEDRGLKLQVINEYRQGLRDSHQQLLRMKHKDGSWRWILSRGFLFEEADGVTKRMIGLHTDITEQKNQQIALQEINEELENFTYIASHDMRSPLVNLKGFTTEIEKILDQTARYLRENRPIPEMKEKLQTLIEEDAREARQFIHAAIERLQFQTDAILRLSRIGRHAYATESVDLNQIVREVLDSLQFELREKAVDIQVEKLPGVITDRVAAQQILGNVIENALKYLDDSRPGVIHISGERYMHETIISVADNGRGIDRKDQKKYSIFSGERAIAAPCAAAAWVWPMFGRPCVNSVAAYGSNQNWTKARPFVCLFLTKR